MKRNTAVDVCAEQIRDRFIRPAFLQVPGALRARPAGSRVTFDNAGRAHSASTPWRVVQDAVRGAAQAAARDGRPVVIAETRARIKSFYATLEADALSQLPPEGDLCVVQAAIEETVAQSPADVAGLELVAKPTCKTRLLNFAAKARHHAGKLLTAASTAERHALHPQTTGLRRWN